MSPESRERIRQLVAAAPRLSAHQRLRLAALLRPDLPVGIREETPETTRRTA